MNKNTPTKHNTAIEWKPSGYNGDLQFPFVQHERYMGNSEWDWYEYEYEETTDASLINNNKAYSTLTFRMKLRRNHPFYSLTLFVPMFVLTVLSPIGLILPGNITECL